MQQINMFVNFKQRIYITLFLPSIIDGFYYVDRELTFITRAIKTVELWTLSTDGLLHCGVDKINPSNHEENNLRFYKT